MADTDIISLSPRLATARLELSEATARRLAAVEKARLANVKLQNLDALYRSAKDAKGAILLEARTMTFTITDDKVCVFLSLLVPSSFFWCGFVCRQRIMCVT